MLSRAEPAPSSDAERVGLRRYVRRTYCDRFDRRGWVYPDGALTIAAQRWAVHSGRCETATATPTGTAPARQVPCRLEDEPLLDCALLHSVRRREVRAYLARLQRRHPVRCDDGTPLDQLGVP